MKDEVLEVALHRSMAEAALGMLDRVAMGYVPQGEDRKWLNRLRSALASATSQRS